MREEKGKVREVVFPVPTPRQFRVVSKVPYASKTLMYILQSNESESEKEAQDTLMIRVSAASENA